jgi:tRNA1(Val) A37 N6-methylase TrmN6
MSLDHADPDVKQQTLTRDAFLDGRLNVSQSGNGFRAGLDSVILGASVSVACTTLLDLGAGVGTAALVALAHINDLNAALAEIDPEIVPIARQNLVDNGFADRAKVLLVDVTAPGAVRKAAGLAPESASSVIANPPFYAASAGTASPNAARSTARHMPAEALNAWVRTAASAATAGGEAIFILPANGLPGLLAAMSGRFGALTLLPLAPREGQPASRILLRGIKGSRAPLTLLPPRALHGPEGRGFTPEFEAIFRGRNRLHW